MEDKGIHVYFSGKVQGVGFRYNTRNFAEKMGLRGWVKNLDDGRVEMYAEGRTDCLQELIEKLNSRFTITQMEKEDCPASGNYANFGIRY